MLRAVTRNLARRPAATSWLRTLLATETWPDVVFCQETPAAILDAPPPGYRLVPGRPALRSSEGMVSSLLLRDDAGDVLVDAPPPFPALGTYAAAAQLQRQGRRIWLGSVHTSPSPVSAEKLRPDFTTRSCEAGPFWSDAFLADLALFAARGDDAILAGDLNQALSYDTDHPGHVCGAEFFTTVDVLGYVDVTRRDWAGVERPTRRHADYQLDRVLASPAAAALVQVDDAEPVHDEVSDHAAIWFSMNV